MSFNTPHSPYGTRFNPNSNQSNLITNPSVYYQTNTQNSQNQKNSENNGPYFNQAPSTNLNLLNVGSRFPQEKNIPQKSDRNLNAWKHSEINTAKSMVFMQSQKQTPLQIPPKKIFGGMTKLSEMARPVNNHIDDADDY